jgi:hypothetical protein
MWLHIGFAPDPDHMRALQDLNLGAAHVDRMKNDSLSASVHTLLDQAGASVVKNWSDAAWSQVGLYAGDHSQHGAMFHIPL